MDSQPTTPNSSPGGEHQPAAKPEELRAETPGAGPAPVESAPVPSAGPGAGEPAQSTPVPPPRLTHDDAAAAAGVMPVVSQPPVTGPAVAGDVDVIEPEWVDKAEDIVRQTQGDPYNEEEAIEDLQQDYLMKRYGHKVADPKPDSSKPEGT